MNRATNTRKIQLILGASLFYVLGLLAAPKLCQASTQQTDNTQMNKGDANKGATTADQQKMNPTDRTITKKIRSAIMGDKSLSTYAHNVKIIAQDGKVTLKGPVRSQDEKDSIGAKATAIAGDSNVTNQLEIAPPKS